MGAPSGKITARDGDAWNYTTTPRHGPAARPGAGEREASGASPTSDSATSCFAVSLWNKKDPILKERLFGLSNSEGNHGEDVKEIYYYLDSSPTHSYMKMLYKYPQAAFPYEQLLAENRRRTLQDPEFELIDTGIFNDDRYFDVFIEYAKADMEDILVRITVHNRGREEAPINILPTCWFRNTWSWAPDEHKPVMMTSNEGNSLVIQHPRSRRIHPPRRRDGHASFLR